MQQFWKNRELVLNAKGARRLLLPLYYRKNLKVIRRYNAQIPYSRDVQPFVAPHGLSGIFISSGAKIDTGCVIFQQVTIGSNTLEETKAPGAPMIGKNVYIGAGAKIIGGVTIGDYARIGANCVVTASVPENATVVLPHPRLILHETPRENKYRPWDAHRADKAEM